MPLSSALQLVALGKWSSDARRPLSLSTCFSRPENLCLTLLPPLVPDPFSLLAFPAKFFEGVVYTLCLHFLSTHSRFNPLQSGFQATEAFSPRLSGTSFLPNPTVFPKAHSPCSVLQPHCEHCCLLELFLALRSRSTFYLCSLASWVPRAPPPPLPCLPAGPLQRLAHTADQRVLPEYLLLNFSHSAPLHRRAQYPHCFNCHLHANDIHGET